MNRSCFILILLFAFLLPSTGLEAQDDWEKVLIADGVTKSEQIKFIDLDSDGIKEWVCHSFHDYGLFVVGSQGDSIFGLSDKIAHFDDYEPDFDFVHIDDDGAIDLVVSMTYEDTLMWLRNDGTGHFFERHYLGFDSDYRKLDIGDFDGDGRVDMACALYNEEISLFRNDEIGDLTYFGNAQSNTDSYVDVKFGDLNAEGNLDLIAISFNGTTNLFIPFFNNENVFSLADYAITGSIYDLNIFDINFDGWNDLIYREPSMDRLVVKICTDPSSFDYINAFLPCQECEKLVVTDVDGTDHVDFLFTEIIENNYQLSLIKVDPFTQDIFQLQEIFSEKQNLCSISQDSQFLVGDQDLDGDLDALIGLSGNFYILDNDAGLLESQPRTINQIGKNIKGTADVNADGRDDVLILSNGAITYSFADDELSIQMGLGDGNFQSVQINTANHVIYDARFSDMDVDGDLDIIGFDKVLGFVYWTNEGSGVFSNLQELTFTDSYVRLIHMSDYNMDGFDDIVYFNNDPENQTLKICYSNGITSFEDAVIISQDYGSFPSMCSGDIDLDGDVDLIFGNRPSGKVWVHYNNNENLFSTELIATSSSVQDVVLNDYDYDGDLDVFYCGFEDIAYSVNDGAGNFEESVVVNASLVNVQDIELRDVNLDGSIDLICIHQNGVSMFLNVDNTFQTEAIDINSYSGRITGLQVMDIVTLDIDSDTDFDVLASYSDKKQFLVLTNHMVEGCTDPTACNYDFEAVISTSECCYGICGCTDPSANNFDVTANCDIGNCIYEMHGYVFHDLNANGIMDGNDYGIPSQVVMIDTSGIFVTTNGSGMFSYQFGVGEHRLAFQATSQFPFLTTLSSYDFLIEMGFESDEIFFGASIDLPFLHMWTGIIPEDNFLLCSSPQTFDICYRNEGNLPVYGILKIEVDNLIDDIQQVSSWDSIVGNTIYFSFENLLPGYTCCEQIQFNAPSSLFIGEDLNFSASVYLFENTETNTTASLEIPVNCGVDPNDKISFPVGYSEEHFIENQTDLEYVIRFQNTGDFPAINVVITDTMDVYLDMDSFEFMASSHDATVVLDPQNRLVKFVFEEIYLPDSLSDEPNSHGFIAFKISPFSDLVHGTVIQNTAGIYFDFNDPVITNTTWHTIYECTNELATISGEIPDQINVPFILTSNEPFIELYEWYFNGVLMSTDDTLNYELTECLDAEIMLSVSNPLCDAVNGLLVDMSEVDTSISISDWTLLAGQGTFWQWYLNGEIIPLANSQTYSVNTSGLYSVEVGSASGCFAMSDEIEVFYINVDEVEYNWNVFPNPVDQFLYLEMDSATVNCEISLMDNLGHKLFSGKIDSHERFQLDVRNFSPGLYTISLRNNDHISYKKLIVN